MSPGVEVWDHGFTCDPGTDFYEEVQPTIEEYLGMRERREQEEEREREIYEEVREIVDAAVYAAEQLGGGWGGTHPADLVISYAERHRPARETESRPPKKAKIPPELRWEVWERDDFTCRGCGTRKHLAVDHIYPESKGGPTTLENLQTLCKPCNSAKGARV